MKSFFFKFKVIAPILLVALMFLAAFKPALAVSSYLGYEGHLSNSSGTSQTGTFSMTFRLYSTLTGGSAVWTETQPTVSVSNGYFSAQLGSVTPLTNINFGNQYYLSLEVQSDGEMTPRQPINSVASSLTSHQTEGAIATSSAPTGFAGALYYNTSTDQLFGFNASTSAWVNLFSAAGTGFIQGGNALGATAVLGTTDNNDLQVVTNNVNRLIVTKAGNVGIGTTTPATALHVVSSTEQLRLGYDAANYASFIVGSGGALTIAPTAASTTLTGQLAVTGASILQSTLNVTGLSTLGNFTASNGTTTNATSTNLFVATAANFGGTLNVTGLSTLGNFTASNGTTTNATSTNLFVSGQTILTPNVGIGTSSPQGLLAVSGSSTLPALNIIATSSAANVVSVNATGTYTNLLNLFNNGVTKFSITNIGTVNMSAGIIMGSNNISTLGSITAGNTTNGVRVNTSLTAATGVELGLQIVPAITETGSAGYSALKIIPTETTVGTGTKNLIQAGTSTAPNLFVVSNLGNVGIGTSTPNYLLQVHSNTAVSGTKMFFISTSTSATGVFSVDGVGNVRYTGSLVNGAADYAEYFYNDQADLAAGDAVCLDLTRSNAVVKCASGANSQIIGIISTKPSLIGNSSDAHENDPHYVMVALLGQVSTKVSAGNSPIKPGDNLTSSDVPGYLRKAEAGEATVGVALESLNSGTGLINVLISRNNKAASLDSLAVLQNQVKSLATNLASIQNQQIINVINTNNPQNNQLTADQMKDFNWQGSLAVAGHITFNEDTAGQAKILAGATSTKVTFAENYTTTPIITVTPLDFDGRWKLTEVASSSFRIALSDLSTSDVIFDWHAFASNDKAKIFSSDGSSQLINVVASPVIKQPEIIISDTPQQPVEPKVDQQPIVSSPTPTEDKTPIVEPQKSDIQPIVIDQKPAPVDLKPSVDATQPIKIKEVQPTPEATPVKVEVSQPAELVPVVVSPPAAAPDSSASTPSQ